MAFYLGIFFCLGNAVVGFNDDFSKDKWSPKFLYEKVYSVPKTVPRPSNPIIPSLPVVYNYQEPEKLVRFTQMYLFLILNHYNIIIKTKNLDQILQYFHFR